MADPKPVILNFSTGTRVIVHPNKITPSKIDKLAEALTEVRQKHSIFNKFPLRDDETIETWQERVLPELSEKAKKSKDETAEVYMARVFKQEVDKRNLIFDTIAVVSQVFGGPLVTEDLFADTSYVEMKTFILEIFKSCDLPTVDYE